MKYRTDFVTNSSSSSFIFKKSISMGELQKEIKEEIKRLDRDKYDLWEDYYEQGTQMLKELEDLWIPVKELDIKTMDEIFEWYYEELVDKTLGKEYDGNSIIDFTKKEEQMIEELIANCTDEQLHKLFSCLALDLILHRIYSTYDSSKDQPLTRVLTYKEMENVITSYLCEPMDSYYFPERVVYQVFLNNYEKGIRFFEEFSSSCIELFQEFFDCEYIFYKDYGVNSVFADVLESVSGCVYGCRHMG